MRPYILYQLLFLSLFQINCKTSRNHDYIKKSTQKAILLSNISNPKVFFILQTSDTIRFSKQDIFNLLDQQLKRELKLFGYISSKELKNLSDSLIKDTNNLLVYQNLSAVSSESISGILDSWVARELLMKGKAEVALINYQKVLELKYIYTTDYLGGKQGTFYTTGDKFVYRTMIALGE